MIYFTDIQNNCHKEVKRTMHEQRENFNKEMKTMF